MGVQDAGVQWLLDSKDPSVRYFALVDVVGLSPNSLRARKAREDIPTGPRVRCLLSGQRAGQRKTSRPLIEHLGGFGVHPYKKWDGAHWRLVSLVELGIPATDERARAAMDQVLQWLTSEKHKSTIRSIDGRTRRCASQEGNALAVCCRLGMKNEPRVRYLAESLVQWQWEDGGWNCDKRPEARHSSFYESLAPLWGLIEYYQATGEEKYHKVAERVAEMFLRHRLFRSEATGRVIDPEWLRLHYPLYWHYDVLQCLVILSRLGKIADSRASEALDILESKRCPDGTWHAEGFYWTMRKDGGSNCEVVDWGRKGPNEMITLNALRVLRAAGRL